MPKVLKLKEVAEYLRLSPMTIYRMTKSGEIPCFKLGDEWRFRTEAIEQWIMEQERQTAPIELKIGNNN
jgi:excisionase family DNA binding protein